MPRGGHAAPRHAAEAVIALARQIDTLDAAGVRQLMQLAGCFA